MTLRQELWDRAHSLPFEFQAAALGCLFNSLMNPNLQGDEGNTTEEIDAMLLNAVEYGEFHNRLTIKEAETSWHLNESEYEDSLDGFDRTGSHSSGEYQDFGGHWG